MIRSMELFTRVSVTELLTADEKPYLIYFSGNYREREDFERAGDFQGTDEYGNVHAVKVRKAKCYQQALANLYQVFVYNKIRWTTVNTAYLDRFYEVTTEDESRCQAALHRFCRL